MFYKATNFNDAIDKKIDEMELQEDELQDLKKSIMEFDGQELNQNHFSNQASANGLFSPNNLRMTSK